MPDDPARPPLDQPTAEPVPESASRHRDRSRPSPLIGWLLVAIAGVGLFISTPPSGGPDEPAQELTAWYLSGHGLRPASIEWFSVPVSFSVHPCFIGSSVVASCMPPRSAATATVSTSAVLSYAPPYYWFVGMGERLAASVAGIEYADVGGRLASFLLNFGALFLLSLYMRRRTQWWGTFLLLVSTPMAVFMGMVVNPSGWEITCGIVMATVLSEAVWSRRSLGSDPWPKTLTLMLVAASVALSLARPLGFVWGAGLTVSAVAFAPSINRRLLLRVACAAAPGVILGMLLLLTNHQFTLSDGNVASPTTIADLAAWLATSLLLFPLRLYEMFGILGWFDTPAPLLLLLVNVLAWRSLLIALPRVRKAAVACGIVGIVILPSAIETSNWANFPEWWQGRYTLPFALGFGLLLLLRSGHSIPRTISTVSGISLLSLGAMVWINAIRYDFGVNLLGLPVSLEQQGISPARLLLSAAIGALLMLVSGYLLVQARRMKPDLRLGPDQETLSAPREVNAG
jgi:hypothetical protein